MPESISLRAARPSINIDGRDDGSLSAGLLRLTIVENTAGLYRCEATFGNWGNTGSKLDYIYFDLRTLNFGKSLKIKVDSEALFDGRITALEAEFPNSAPGEFTVLAEDRFQDLRMTRRTRTFTDSSDSNVFTRIAGDHGLTPSISVTGPTHKVLAQTNQSDLAFMRERARAIDAELWMSAATLNVKSRSSRNGSTLQMTYGNELHDFTVTADLAQQRTSVYVNGWDVANKSALQYEATDSIINGELGSDTSGASLLSSAFGKRKEALAHTVPLTSQEAQAHAESYFKMQARRFITGRGTATTHKDLRVGNYVDLKNLGPLFSGKYYVTEVRHTFDMGRGMRTAFTAERPGMGQAR